MNVALVVVVLVLAVGGSVLLAIRGLGIGARRNIPVDDLMAIAEATVEPRESCCPGAWFSNDADRLEHDPGCVALAEPRGRHHAPPRQSHGHDVITAKIHYLDDKRGAQ